MFQSITTISVTLLVLLLQSTIDITTSLELSSMKKHYSNFKARQNHPTTYEDSPDFKGPLILTHGVTTSDNRCRIKNYYLEHGPKDDDDNMNNDNDNSNNESGNTNDNDNANTNTNTLIIPKEQLRPLKETSSTDNMLKTIVDHLAYRDAPVDVKEVAESIEFYLRTRKRLMGAAKKYHACYKRNCKAEGIIIDEQDNFQSSVINVKVFDLCSGHGLTGILFAACNPPSKHRIVNTILVDQTEPPSHKILRNLIGEVCPWLNNNDSVKFETMSLEEFGKEYARTDSNNGEARAVIATHACGNLTDKVLELAVDLGACGIAAMPCCYTGTDKGTPYGIKRALGVSWAADIRRSFYLNENKYHSDFSSIPTEITPMNRIIIGEDRS